MRVINLISDFKSQQKMASAIISGSTEQHAILTAKQLLKYDVEKLHFHHHRLMLDVKQNVAAAKIQHFVRAIKVRRAYQYFIQ